MADSISKILKSYQVLSAPTSMSTRINCITTDWSHDNAMRLTRDEMEKFLPRLQECDVSIMPSIRAGEGKITTFQEVVKLFHSEENKVVDKQKRLVIHSVANGIRPVGNKAYEDWNGMQIIDMDIKNREVAERLKIHIFEALKNCNWFLGVVFSSSGKGLHIYTKIRVQEGLSLKDRKLLYWVNFRHKYSFVYIACLNGLEDDLLQDYTKNDIKAWMDFSMMRPSQGAFIGYDEKPFISSHFFEDFIYINFDNIESTGHPEIDWVSNPDLKDIFAKYEFFDVDDDSTPEIKILNKTKILDDGTEVIDEEFSPTGERVHYKHHERWKLANTLVKGFGVKAGYSYLRAITSLNVKDKELLADCQTAARYKKDYDPWAIMRLNKFHGIKIKAEIDQKLIEESELLSTVENISQANMITNSSNYEEMHIKASQYLGHIREKIEDHIFHSRHSRITLIEAGPGLGKTEMVKSMVNDGKKLMLVMPFTSTIKSKVEKEEGWYYSYGSRKPKLTVEKGLALTLDKFSRLNMMDIKTHGFDVIIIDESHLLFMSEYRSIMSKVVEMISATEVPIILMTGTPTGELVFFPNIYHIKVIRDETRRKELKVYMVDNTSNLLYHMCRAMANSIAKKRKVLYPSNEGMTHSKRIKAGIEWFLQNEHQMFDPINLQYYKKSQIGEEFMDDINFHKTVRDIDVLMCTSYLSVGVDIVEKEPFDIFFGDLCTAAEADQWANRLRRSDLYISLYVAKADADGNPRYINKFHPLNMKLNDAEIMDMHSIVRICNASLERNPTITKYNPIVSNILQSNNYIEFDPVTRTYKLNELAYKLTQFEDKIRDYQEQLPVFMKGMQEYGYDISAKDVGGFTLEGEELFSDIKNMIKNATDAYTNEKAALIEEFLEVISSDIETYKEAMAGHLDFYKGRDWKVDVDNSRIVVKSVEIAERITPIYLSLLKRYEPQEVNEIFEFCRKKNGAYNMAALSRMRSLINLTKAKEDERLDLPIEKYIMDVNGFYDDCDGKTTRGELAMFINDHVKEYEQLESTQEWKMENSVNTTKRLKTILEGIFSCLMHKSRPNKKGELTIEKVELLWQTREDKFINADKNIKFSLVGFLDDAIPVTTSEVIEKPIEL